MREGEGPADVPADDAAAGPTGRYWEATDLVRRLRRVEGQARGLQAMVQRGERCKEIETQIAAMQGALVQVMRVVQACRVAEAIEVGVGPLDSDRIRQLMRRDILS